MTHYFCSFTAPTAAPTDIEWLPLGCTTVLIYWQAPAGSIHQRGNIKGYHVKIKSAVTVSKTVYENNTDNQFMIVNDLDADGNYTVTIAAYTTMMGPFSQLVSLTPHSQNLACLDTCNLID